MKTKLAIQRVAPILVIGLFGVMLPSAPIAGQEPPPVASFDAPTADGDARGATDAVPNDPSMSFNFRYAPWPDVLKLFAETAGLTLDLNETPPGTFSYFDRGKYTPTEALDILNGYLLPRGYVLVRRDQFLVCVNIEKGIPPNLVPKVSVDELSQRGNNELLTVVFELEGHSAEQAGAEVQQLLGPQGKAVALKAAGLLLVTDIGSNLRLVDSLLERSTAQPAPVSTGDTAFRAFPLEYISAYEAARLVRDLFGMPDEAAASATHPPSPAARPGSAAGTIQLTAESRTNSLLVTASPNEMRIIEQVLQVADVEIVVHEGSPAGGGFRRSVQVVPLGSANSVQIGRALGSLSPRIRVTTTGKSHAAAKSPEARAAAATHHPPAGRAGVPPGGAKPPPNPGGPDASDGRPAAR